MAPIRMMASLAAVSQAIVNCSECYKKVCKTDDKWDSSTCKHLQKGVNASTARTQEWCYMESNSKGVLNMYNDLLTYSNVYNGVLKVYGSCCSGEGIFCEQFITPICQGGHADLNTSAVVDPQAPNLKCNLIGKFASSLIHGAPNPMTAKFCNSPRTENGVVQVISRSTELDGMKACCKSKKTVCDQPGAKVASGTASLANPARGVSGVLLVAVLAMRLIF